MEGLRYRIPPPGEECGGRDDGEQLESKPGGPGGLNEPRMVLPRPKEGRCESAQVLGEELQEGRAHTTGGRKQGCRRDRGRKRMGRRRSGFLGGPGENHAVHTVGV